MGIYITLTPSEGDPATTPRAFLNALLQDEAAAAWDHPEYDHTWIAFGSITTFVAPREDLPLGALSIRMSNSLPALTECLHGWFDFAQRHGADFWWGHERMTIQTLPNMVVREGGDHKEIMRLLGRRRIVKPRRG